MASLTAEQYQMLSNIFRLILQEIKVDSDKDKLAPGEMGINYTTGSLYIKNPNTGNLFSPNGIENMQLLLSKFNTTTGLLNADSLDNIHFYGSISEVSVQSMTPDTLIATMIDNSFLVSLVDYTSNTTLNYPTASGFIMVYKISNAYVTIKYTDLTTGTEYTGIYDGLVHKFIGWKIHGVDTSRYFDLYTITGNVAALTFDNIPKDLSYITIYSAVTVDLSTVTFSVNGTSGYKVTNLDGTVLSSTLNAYTYYNFIVDTKRKYLIDTTSHTSPMEDIIYIMNNRT